MRILNLVLYSETQECYGEMKNILSSFYNKNSSGSDGSDTVRTIYYKYSPTIGSDYVMKDDVLRIKGNESFVPGILNKTLKAFEFVLQTGIMDDFDYIIRSNISTVINFDLLINELRETPLIYYGGGLIHTLRWRDPNAGIKDDEYNGTSFANGTSIMMTKEALRYLIDNKDLIKKDIVDDVAIGIFFKENQPAYYPPQEVGWKKYLTMDLNYNTIEGENKLKTIVDGKQFIFYRNRWGQRDRMVDVSHMKLLTHMLQ